MKDIFQVACVITKWYRLTELDFKDRECGVTGWRNHRKLRGL